MWLQLCRPAIQSHDGPSNPALQTQSPDVWLQERVLLLLQLHGMHPKFVALNIIKEGQSKMQYVDIFYLSTI